MIATRASSKRAKNMSIAEQRSEAIRRELAHRKRVERFFYFSTYFLFESKNVAPSDDEFGNMFSNCPLQTLDRGYRTLGDIILNQKSIPVNTINDKPCFEKILPIECVFDYDRIYTAHSSKYYDDMTGKEYYSKEAQYIDKLTSEGKLLINAIEEYNKCAKQYNEDSINGVFEFTIEFPKGGSDKQISDYHAAKKQNRMYAAGVYEAVDKAFSKIILCFENLEFLLCEIKE